MTANVVHPAELERMLQARVEAARERRAERAQSHAGSGGRHTRRRPIALVIGFVLALSATAVLADSGSFSVEVADNTGYEFGTTDDGAIVEYIGQYNTDFGSAGTGVINSFLQTQDTPSEEGYNTDGTKQFDTGSSPTFNRAILVSEIPVLECEALDPSITDPAETGLCWELFADINDSNANDPDAAQIQLTELEVWLTANAEITGYDQTGDAGFTSGATEVYDFEGTILINDVNSGSGRGDMRYLVPLDGISLATLAPDCDYGSSACETYFVVYTEWGDTEGGDYISDSGFEEWTVKRYPFLDVEKTATTTFTRTFAWTIEKSANPATWNLFDGDTGTSDWTVALTKDNGSDTDHAVSGTITITNPSDQDATLQSVTDSISGFGGAAVNCGVTVAGHVLEPGDSLVCTYSSSLPDDSTRTNTATVTLDSGQAFTDDALVTFGDPTTLVNDTVDVTDTNGMSWDDVADDASFTYPETFACGVDEGTHTNTATITQTGQFDSATVTVTCYDLDVTKTAVPTFSRDFDWTIEKTVDPTTLDLFDGDSDDVTWTVTWTKGAAEDFGYTVSGQITVDNNHPSLGAVINSVSDVISPAIAAVVDCGAATFPHTIAASGTLVCTYSSALPDDATRTNTATATQQNFNYASDLTATASGTTDYWDTESVDFTGVNPTVTDDTATLSDARAGNTIDGDNVSTSGSASWDETFECGDDEGPHANSATVTEDDSLDPDTDDATVTVNCYELTVTKDATTTYSRDYDWDIAKTRFIAIGENDGDGDPLTLTLDEGQTYTANYRVTVTMTGFTDDDHAVSGTITINNPAPMIADDVAVTDVLSHAVDPDINATVDCGGGLPTVDVPAAGSAQCSYSADLPDADDRLNTATATLFGIGYDGTANVTFDLDNPTVEIDECIDITDDAGTPLDISDDIDLGTVCVDDLDASKQWSDEYQMDIGPFAVCGEYTFTNRVTFVTTDDANDTDESDWAEYTVTIDVPCPEGCTLTQGYWKTHNESFWGGAPVDETWELLGDADGDLLLEAEDEEFFLSGMTYFEVMWQAPQGNVYFNLAHQYIAAQLNMLDGADGSAITTAFDEATALFETWTDEEIAELKGKNGKELRAEFIELAGILASYNEGDIGPGHCDEDQNSDPALTGSSLLLADRRTSFTIG